MRNPLVRQLLFFAIIISTLLPLAVFPVVSNNFQKLTACPQLTDGVLNLEAYDFSNSPAIPLNGNWRHYEGKWIVTDKKTAKLSPTLAAIPTPWNRRQSRKYSQQQNRKESYSITLINCPKDIKLVSFIPNMNTNYRIFLDGNIVYSNDSLLYLDAPQKNINAQLNNDIPERKENKAELVIEFQSNTNHNLYFTPVLSESKKEFINFVQNNSITNVYIGIVILSIAYFATVILLRDKSFPSIALLLLDCIVLMRLLFKNNFLILYLCENLNLNYDIFNGFMMTTTLFLPIIFLFCACQLLNLAINKKHIIALLIYELFFCPFIFLSVLCGHLIFLQILCVFNYLPFTYMLWLIYKEVKNDKPYILAVTGILLLLISAIIMRALKKTTFFTESGLLGGLPWLIFEFF